MWTWPCQFTTLGLNKMRVPFTDHSLVVARGLALLNEATSYAVQGHPRQTGQSEEFWQNVVPWRKGWQITPVFLPQKPHEQYKKRQNIWHQKRSSPRSEGVPLGKSREQLLIAPERMKVLGQSRNDAQLWMCLVVKIKSNAVKNNIARNLQN